MVSEVTRVDFLKGYFTKRFSKVIPNRKIVQVYVDLALKMAQKKNNDERIQEHRIYKVKSKVYGTSRTVYMDNVYKYDLKYIVQYFLHDYETRQRARVKRA